MDPSHTSACNFVATNGQIPKEGCNTELRHQTEKVSVPLTLQPNG